MRKGAAETEAAALVHCCSDCGNVVPHAPSPPSTPRKTPNIQQSITDTHQKSAPAEGCPTAGQVCVGRRFAAATPWMQIWMLRGGVSVDPWIREEDGSNRRWLTVSLPAHVRERQAEQLRHKRRKVRAEAPTAPNGSRRGASAPKTRLWPVKGDSGGGDVSSELSALLRRQQRVLVGLAQPPRDSTHRRD